MLGLLNTQAGDRYIFSGREAEQPSVASFEHIMDGDGARAGFKQIVSERKLADLGTLGRGRMVISAPTATSVQVAEEAPPTVFGFKLVEHQLDADQFHGHRPGRRAAGDVGRFHRAAQCRRDRPVPLHAARMGRARSSR